MGIDQGKVRSNRIRVGLGWGPVKSGAGQVGGRSSWGRVTLGVGHVESIELGSGRVGVESGSGQVGVRSVKSVKLGSGQVKLGSSQVKSGQVKSGSSQVRSSGGGGPVRSSQVGSDQVGVRSGPVRVQSGQVQGLVVEFRAHNLLRWTQGRIE